MQALDVQGRVQHVGPYSGLRCTRCLLGHMARCSTISWRALGIPTITQDSNSPLSATELKEFRSLVGQANARPGYTMSRIAKELGFADASPLRKILRNPKRTTSRDRLHRLRTIAAGRSSGSPVVAQGTSGTAKSSAVKPSAQGAPTGDAEAYVSKSQAKEFERRVEQLRQSGWTVDALAKRLGYQHGRSLRKTLASGNVRRRVFDAIATLSAKPTGGAKPAGGAVQASKPAPAKVTKSSSAGKFTDRQVSGVTTYLESARRHLDRARDEVARASSASQLLEPGLRALIGEIDDLGKRLEL